MAKGKLMSEKAGPRISGGGNKAVTFTAPKGANPGNPGRFVPKAKPKAK